MMVTGVTNNVKEFGQTRLSVVNRVSFMDDAGTEYRAEYISDHKDQTIFVKGQRVCFVVGKFSPGGTPEVAPVGVSPQNENVPQKTFGDVYNEYKKAADAIQSSLPPRPVHVAGTARAFAMGYAKDILVAKLAAGLIGYGDDLGAHITQMLGHADRIERWLENKPKPEQTEETTPPADDQPF